MIDKNSILEKYKKGFGTIDIFNEARKSMLRVLPSSVILEIPDDNIIEELGVKSKPWLWDDIRLKTDQMVMSEILLEFKRFDNMIFEEKKINADKQSIICFTRILGLIYIINPEIINFLDKQFFRKSNFMPDFIVSHPDIYIKISHFLQYKR